MSALAVFNFEQQQIRTAVVDNNVWFVAKDLAEALDYAQTQNALNWCKKSCSQHELNKINNLSPATKWIPESDMYRLIMKSTKPEAEKFQDWVVEDVLPAIRKTGKYSIGSDQFIDPLAERKLRLEEARLQKEVTDMMLGKFTNLSDNAKQVLAVKTAETAFGEKMPFLLPVIETNLKSATDIAVELGITAQRVGIITNKLNLKNSEFAECRLSKSRHSDKQVESWFYKPEAIAKIKSFLSN